MASETTNLKLVKPSEEDYYDINVFNGNSDKVDAAYKSTNDKIQKIVDDSGIIKGTLDAGDTSIEISDTKIKTTSALSFYTSVYGVNPTAVSVAAGKVTLTFDSQESDLEVGVRVDG